MCAWAGWCYSSLVIDFIVGRPGSPLLSFKISDQHSNNLIWLHRFSFGFAFFYFVFSSPTDEHLQVLNWLGCTFFFWPRTFLCYLEGNQCFYVFRSEQCSQYFTVSQPFSGQARSDHFHRCVNLKMSSRNFHFDYWAFPWILPILLTCLFNLPTTPCTDHLTSHAGSSHWTTN